MIYTIDDLNDKNERLVERERRKTHERYMSMSPASGSWWRAALDVGEDERQEDDLALAPDGSSVHRRIEIYPANTPTFKPSPPPTWSKR